MSEKLEVIISADASDLTNEVEEAQKEIKTFSQRVKDAMGDMDKTMADAGQKIGDALSNGINAGVNAVKTGAKALAGAMTAVSGAVIGVVKGTEEYRNDMAKLTTAFEATGASAETAKGVYTDLYAIMGDSGAATEAAQMLAQLSNNQQDLAEWTNICSGVYAEMGSTLPIEGLAEAANETAKVGQITGSMADAINWVTASNEEWATALSGNQNALDAFNKAIEEGASKEDAFNAALAACNTEAEREKLIRETLNSLYSDSAARFEENNKNIIAQREAQAQLTETMAKLGEALAPVVTLFTQLAAEALSYAQPYIEKFAEKIPEITEKIRELAAEWLPKLGEALKTMADLVGKVIGFVVDNWALIAGIAGVIGTIVAAIGLYNAVAAVKAAMAAAEVTTVMGLVGAYTAQAAAMAVALAPYALIVAAIGAVIAIVVLLIKHWDEIGPAIKAAFDKAKEIISDFVAKAGEFFNNLIGAIGEKIEAIKNAVTNKFNEMKTNVGNKFEEMKKNISEKNKEIATNVSQKFEEVKKTMTDAMEQAKTNVQNKLNNIKDAYNSHGGGVKGIVAGFSQAIQEYYKTLFNILNTLTGGKLGDIANIFKDKMNNAKKWVSDILDGIKKKFSDIMDNVKRIVSNAVDKLIDLFDFNWELPKIKLPHFKISGEFSLNPPSIPKISVDWYANGGVFDSPTLFGYNGKLGGLGEDGAEAIVPLEKNTYWLDRIATMLAEKTSSNQPIVLTVDGKVFAQTAISTMNDLTRQTGKLNLIMV